MISTEVNSREFMEKMGKLMTRSLETPEGKHAMAEAIAPPIEMEINRRIITPLLLTEHPLPPGQPAKYQKVPGIKAHWIATGGIVTSTDVADFDEVEFPIDRIPANPMVDISALQSGNVGTLTDHQNKAANAIRKEVDKRTMSLLSASVPQSNIITITSGGKLTETAFYQAIAKVEDLELNPKFILMRGARMSDLKSWSNLDPQTNRELFEKGVVKTMGGAGLINTAAASLSEVIIVPDTEIGKYAVRSAITAEPYKDVPRFKVGWVVWMECALGITRPDLLFKIVING
ncbi:MAG: hypothetical protein OEM52_07410 [bacterium]|nr:hypothetical protein [bacterium]